LIGYTKGNTEFGAMQQMHVYGGSSLITAKDKIEYKAPDMNKLPEIGNFEYSKSPTIISANWVDESSESYINDLALDKKASIIVHTRNAEQGESIEVQVDEIDIDKQINSVTYKGVVNENGIAVLDKVYSFKK
ncbi:MAG: Rhs element Vgr protein, partial [Moheibacter sp.]